MMPETARKEQDIARFQPEIAQVEQQKPWERQKSEPARWFLRFQIYRNLGPKRSLRATIAAETEAGQETKSNRKKQQTNTSQNLSDVSVPGSWSRAAKVWNWRERAASWDQDRLIEQGKRFQQSVGNCEYASRVGRIQVLNKIILSYIPELNKPMDLKLHMETVKLVQSLMKQIADEMSEFSALDTTELDGRVARYLSEHAEERKQKRAAMQQTRAGQDTILAGTSRLSNAEFERLLAEGNSLLKALGER
jgi:hypothetical protein